MTEKMIVAAVQNHPSAIVILDVQSFGNWLEIAKNIELLSRTVRICLISGTAEPAIEAINSLKTVCGYVCKGELVKMFEEVFARLYGKLKTVCGGIAVTYYNTVDKVIPFEDILFIETLKQTHMCTVVHKNGTDQIRANISKLINELPEVFQIVRSSAIANFSEVRSFSNCELFFSDGSSCLCSRKYTSDIIAFMEQAVLGT
ncbi:MAG: LytTR family transcriptional regulator DNA-binding domain-containing protein [Oscillospiraceae bacterium]